MDTKGRGPYSFTAGSEIGTVDYTPCLWDDDFSITHDGSPGWEGEVSVQSLLLDNTIYVPSDESWIVHGTVGSNGLPVTLDSRFESGSYTQISHANLVFRYFRITGQMAPLDLDVAARTYSKRQVTPKASPSPVKGAAERMAFAAGRRRDGGSSGRGLGIQRRPRRDADLRLDGLRPQLRSEHSNGCLPSVFQR